MRALSMGEIIAALSLGEITAALSLGEITAPLPLLPPGTKDAHWRCSLRHRWAEVTQQSKYQEVSDKGGIEKVSMKEGVISALVTRVSTPPPVPAVLDRGAGRSGAEGPDPRPRASQESRTGMDFLHSALEPEGPASNFQPSCPISVHAGPRRCCLQ